MFRKIPFILIAMILAIIFLNQFIPIEIKKFLYSISLSIKTIIVFVLPMVIFGLLFKTAVNLASSATRIIVMLLIFVCLSNFVTTLLSYCVGRWVYEFDLSLIVPNENEGLKVLWEFELPKLVSNAQAMFGGLILGIISGIFRRGLALKLANKLEWGINKFLTTFIYLIPLFVAGFVVKLEFDGMMSRILKDYALIFAIIGAAQLSYIGLIYLVANNFRVKGWMQSIKNMIPACIAGFSTMSSAAAMPLTLIGVEKMLRIKI